MKETQIVRFPKKYIELITTLSACDAGLLIQSLFTCNSEGLQGVLLVYYNMMVVDLENLEKSATNGNKGGRPKEKKTTGYGNNKPGVIKNDNLKEEKDKEKKKDKEKIRVIVEEEEMNALLKRRTEQQIKSKIEDMEIYLTENPKKKYASYYLALVKRLKKDCKEKPVRNLL